MQVTTIGLDLAKRVFQVHGVDADGRVVVQRRLQRGEVAAFFADLPPCRVGIEACATAHYWARLIGASGHQVRLIPPSYVKPYVRRSKTDAADAAAICESVGRPSMRFVPVKSAAQQAALLHHRVRDLLVRQRTMLINALRGHFAEFGIIAPVGRHRVVDLISRLQDVDDANMPALAREALRSLIAELRALGVRRPRTGGMDRLGSTPALKRGQTEARTRVQARRPLSKTLAHHWCDLGNAAIAGQDGRALGLGQDVAGSPSVPVGLVSTGEQDGADRLGSHGAARGL